MSPANNPDDRPDLSNQPDSGPPAFVVVAIPLEALVPDEVLDEVEIFMTEGGQDDSESGDDGVALSS